MNLNKTLITLTICVNTVFTGSASAHTLGAHSAGFVEGLAHPFVGLDHLLAMVADWSVGCVTWGAGALADATAFITVLAGAAGLALFGLELPLVEAMIAASVLVLGSMVAGSVRVSGWASMLAVSLFALFHGYAHGLDMPQAAMPWAYATGFILATAMLHGLGINLWLILSRFHSLPRIGGQRLP